MSILFWKTRFKEKLGTGFYNIALYTKGGILLHPGKLVRAMIEVLPNNVQLLEKTQLIHWENKQDYVFVNLTKEIKARK